MSSEQSLPPSASSFTQAMGRPARLSTQWPLESIKELLQGTWKGPPCAAWLTSDMICTSPSLVKIWVLAK